MTQRETQAPGRAAAAGTQPAARGRAVPAAPTTESRTQRTPLWEDLYHGVPAAKRFELLSLARCQGLLYAHQVPALQTPTPSDRAREIIPPLLNGQTDGLDVVRGEDVSFHDTELDETQRDAVARALATPDIFLLQGSPGTGRSRALAEIIVQAAARGERVVVLAPSSAALDRLLQLVSDREDICAVRCLERDEKPESLPAFVQPLTFAERVRRLDLHAREGARRTLEHEQERCDRLLQDQAIWPRLLALVEADSQLTERMTKLQSSREQIPQDVEREAQADTTSSSALAARVKALDQTQLAAEAAHLASENQARTKLEETERETAALAEALTTLAPLVEAKQAGRWWTSSWWQAVLKSKGQDISQWQALHERQQELACSAADLRAEIAQLAVAFEQSRRSAAEQRRHLLDEELAARCQDLESQLAQLERQREQVGHAWQEELGRLDPATSCPAARATAAVEAARVACSQRLQEHQENLNFARQWAAYLDQAGEHLSTRLSSCANVVAATTTAFPLDGQFGDASANGVSNPRQFDLLVLEEADQVSESEFFKLARRARRWILVGELQADVPVATSSNGNDRRPPLRGRPTKPVSLQPALFRRLWQRLHCDPNHAAAHWSFEGDRLCCSLRPIRSEDRRWLEPEPVADAPDIELRILAIPSRPPALAEVVFPATTTIADAKRYLFQELGEVPLCLAGRSLRWVESTERVQLRLANRSHDLVESAAVPLAPGVREMLLATEQSIADGEAPQSVEPTWQTCCLEFERAEGWSRADAEAWVFKHIGLRDLGRTALLSVPHRMSPNLSGFVAALLPGLYVTARDATQGGDAPWEFVPVPGHVRRRGAPAPTLDAAELAALTRRGGAGLELDLADLRHRDRLPTELRAALPARGLVNYLEAQALLRVLVDLATEQRRIGKGQRPTVAALALYPAQAELLRLLVRQTPSLANAPFDLEIGVPTDWQQREANIVLLSLTRSHSHRAVPFGDEPQALTLALTRARARLVLFGDVGTIHRRTQWEGALDHLDPEPATRERETLTRLLRCLQEHGSRPQLVCLAEGSGP